MKKMSYKSVTIVYILVLYFVFSGIIFFIYNNYYMKNMKADFIKQNKYAATVAEDMIEKERVRLAIGARMAASDDFVYYALKNGIYLENKAEITEENLKIKTKKIGKIDYINLVSIVRDKIYGKGRGSEEIGMEIFDENFSMVGSSVYFPKKFIDTGKEKYITDSFGSLNLGGVEITLVEKRENEFVLKAMASVGKNSRYTYEKPYGVVVVAKTIDGVFLEDIKRTINKEMFIYSDDKIMQSTMFDGDTRIGNMTVDILKASGEDEYSFCEILINKNNMGITYFPVKDYDGKIIAYFGVGSSFENMTKMYWEGIRQFIKYEIIISLVMIFIVFFTLGRLFNPFYKLIPRIRDIQEGIYDSKIFMKEERQELQIFIDGINSLAEAVENREEQMAQFNLELEDKVLNRTKEIYEKNSQLEKLLAEIERVNRKMNEEIRTAQKIHSKISAFIDPELKKYSIKHENISITGIGGDFIETVFLSNGKKGIFFADVSGHGVAAALLVSALKIIISIYFKKIENPADALYILNDMINENFIEGITISAVYMIIDEEDDEIEMSLCSQEEVYFISNNSVDKIKGKGLILGVLTSEEIKKSNDFNYKNIRVNLKKCEKIFLYTDGLIEKGILTRDELYEILNTNKQEKSEKIMQFFRENINPKILKREKDDVTYLIIEKSC